jgi:rhodanese-related sulfurtransferase
MSKGVMQMIGEAKSRVGTASVGETAEKLKAGSAVVVDVREPTEWDHGHIEGSVPAPRGLLEFFADSASPKHAEALDPARPVIVVCHSGARAALAAATLQDMGFSDVSVLEGGLTAWLAAGLPTTEHEYVGI